MRLFPPAPKKVEEAISYVKGIPRRRGMNDYQAVRMAGIGPLIIAPMFFVFMALSMDDPTPISIVLGIGYGLFGTYSILFGYRTLELLDLFTNTNLPSPTDSQSRHRP